MLTADERGVLARLEEWQAKLDRLMGMYERERAVMPARQWETARALYRDIKRGLQAEYKRDSSSRRHPPLNDAERRWYQRTIHEAYCHLYAPLNSTPDRWFSSLYEARSDISLTIFKMKDKGGA